VIAYEPAQLLGDADDNHYGGLAVLLLGSAAVLYIIGRSAKRAEVKKRAARMHWRRTS
jgi:hypothetical protein